MRPIDVKDVDVADIYKGEQLAGHLSRIDEGVSFRYTDNYISGENDAVASTLPIRAAAYLTRSGAIPAFFAGLLPEGARLNAVIAATKTSSDDELSLLLAVGEDTVGDIRIVPQGQIPSPATGVLPTKPQEISFLEMFADSIDPLRSELDRALPGVQDKLSDAMMSFPLRGAKGPSILKLNPSSFPRIVENEAFCLRLARRAGLTVPKFDIIKDRDGNSGLLVERFDRKIVDGTIVRVAQEDACQLLNRWPADKYRVTFNDIANRLVSVASSGVSAVMNLVEQIAFNWIIGNGDMHAKNYSVQWLKHEQLVVPTPAYDLVSTLPYPLDQHMALKLDGRNGNLRGKFLITFASRFGIPESMSRRRLSALAERVSPHINDVSSIGYNDQTTLRLIDEINLRLNTLCRFD